MFVSDMSCIPSAPEIPTHSEYTLESDDGTVTVNSLEYPSQIRTSNLVLTSKYNTTHIAKNYMANLT